MDGGTYVHSIPLEMGKLLNKIAANNRCYFRNTLGILELVAQKLIKHQLSEFLSSGLKNLKGLIFFQKSKIHLFVVLPPSYEILEFLSGQY